MATISFKKRLHYPLSISHFQIKSLIHCIPITIATTKLASDVIEEILLRLPAKSILRFVSACHLFNDVTTTQKFISAHTQRCRSSSFTASDIILYKKEIPYQYSKLRDLTGGTSIVPLRIPRRYRQVDHEFYIEDIYDGFMCLLRAKGFPNLDSLFSRAYVLEKMLLVFNPLTKECYSAKFSVMGTVRVAVFYYHEHSKKYRILLSIELNEKSNFALFTIGAKRMSKVENPTPYSPILGRKLRALVNGNFYCFGREGDDMKKVGLIEFNLETEIVSRLRLPVDFDIAVGDSTLFVIEEKLCLFNIELSADWIGTEMWVLVDCREGIWIKKQVVNLELLDDFEQNYSAIFYRSLYFIFVDSNSSDVALPDSQFTFYSLKVDLPRLPSLIFKSKIVVDYSFFHFKEILASVARTI